ncbi:MAG: DUF222 domain-containing protein [Mycobacteriales bacterium]|nr:MAG: hypothetical protein DLM56_11005 [Pseudonocardiales bacterium]
MFETAIAGALDALCTPALESVGDETVLERIEALERIRSRVDAEQCVALADFARRRESDECGATVGDEVGLALRIAPRTADRRIDVAVALTDRLPATTVAMRAGKVTMAKARVLLEETGGLDGAAAATVERAVLDHAAQVTPGQLRRRVARAVIAIDAAAAVRRRRQAETERSVWMRPDANGMATLGAHLCAADAVGIFTLLDGSARAARAAGDARTLEQLRADTLVQAIGGGPSPAAEPLVQITVSADAVVDDGAAPGELAGYGPIDHELSRRIVATGSWQRLLTDPATGQVTDVGRTRYRPPAALAELVRARDRSCAFPTCERRSAGCDLDHRRRWSAGGVTSAANLWPLCSRHHVVKDGADGWSCELLRDGRVAWTTPSGRVYTVYRTDVDGDIDIMRVTDTGPSPPPAPAAIAQLPPPF